MHKAYHLKDAVLHRLPERRYGVEPRTPPIATLPEIALCTAVVGSVTVFYRETGDRQNPILLLHGFPYPSFCKVADAAALSPMLPSRRRAIALGRPAGVTLSCPKMEQVYRARRAVRPARRAGAAADRRGRVRRGGAGCPRDSRGSGRGGRRHRR